MAKARERLMQFGLAQREAEEMAAQTQAQLQNRPRGGEILTTRRISPSEAEQLTAEGAPLIDFAEFFLNQIGISSPRQRRAAIESMIAVDEANKAMINAAQEKFAIIAQRGVAGGIEADRLNAIRVELEQAAALMDNPLPEIQEFGRSALQVAVDQLDALQNEQQAFYNATRDRLQQRVDSLIDIGREDQRAAATITAFLNERGEREGMTSKLSVLEKQVLAEYLGGSNFQQKVGEEGLIPGLAIQFDPTEEITVGDASALVQAAIKARHLTIADQIGDVNAVAVSTGFKLADEDGRLMVNEITSPPLGPLIEETRFASPPGQPFTIRPGIASPEDATRSAEGLKNRVGALIELIPGIKPARSTTTDLFERIGNIPEAIENLRSNPRTPGLFQPGGFFDRRRQEKETN